MARRCVTLQVVFAYDVNQGPITAIALTPEQCFLVGTATGALAAFAPDPRRRITRRLPLTDGGGGGSTTNRRSSDAGRNGRGSDIGSTKISSGSGGSDSGSLMSAAAGT